MTTTIAVREGESFDSERVELFLRSKLTGIPPHPMTVRQFAEGHSNLTYLLTCGDWKAVLRRPPLGPVAPKAHDMKREFQVLEAISPFLNQAPTPLVYCEDQKVMEAPFYVMEFLDGEVVDSEWPISFPDTEEARRKASLALVKMLADIHSVSLQNPEVSALGHGAGYMLRQVEGWVRRHELAQTDEENHLVKKVGTWLLDHIPNDCETTLIHNDFKFNNVVFHPGDPQSITGVVDWEMATLGDPLSDLAITLSYWAEAGDPPALSHGLGEVTAQPGFFSREELLQTYSQVTGRDIAHMGFYLTFAYYKAAGICQQIYYRWWRGQTRDERFRRLGPLAKGLVELAGRQAKL